MNLTLTWVFHGPIGQYFDQKYHLKQSKCALGPFHTREKKDDSSINTKQMCDIIEIPLLCTLQVTKQILRSLNI